MLKLWRRHQEKRLKQRTLGRWLARADVAARVQEVLSLEMDAVPMSVTRQDPRSLPGNPEFRRSGWTEHMLLRYLLAMEHAEGKQVLDSCCGLGWGSHLVALVAERVEGIDIDQQSIDFCQQRWGGERTHYVVGDVLELPFEPDSFDVVLCMEAIEHFTCADGARYLGQLETVCRDGGVLVGSSAFPETREEAERLCSQNEHHLHIYTRSEMADALSRGFGKPELLTSHYFVARKSSL